MNEDTQHNAYTPKSNSGARLGYFYVAIIFVLLVVIIAFVGLLHGNTSKEGEQGASALQAFPMTLDISENDITAKSAVVLDTVTGTEFFTKNASVQLPLASLTKMMLAYVVSDYFSPNDIVSIPRSALSTEGESGFVATSTWYFQDLLDFTLMTSSNDGAVALAQNAETFMQSGDDIETKMNATAQAWGLTQTYFLNETGLDEDEVAMSGAYGSARDVAHMLARIYATDPDLLAATTQDTHTFSDTNGTAYAAENTNDALHNIPGLVAGKTGYTDLAGGNLAVAFEIEPAHPIVIVVLGSTFEGRFADVSSLVQAFISRDQAQ